LLIKGAGNADTLALTTREADATFANKGLVFLRPAFNAVGNLSLLGGLPDALEVDLVYGHAKGNVFSNSCIC
jgi:hypothetical protein